MERKYDATYRFPGSKTVVHIVASPPMTEEEKENVLKEYDRAFWAAWNSLTYEERVKITQSRISSAAEYMDKQGEICAAHFATKK